MASQPASKLAIQSAGNCCFIYFSGPTSLFSLSFFPDRLCTNVCQSSRPAAQSVSAIANEFFQATESTNNSYSGSWFDKIVLAAHACVCVCASHWMNLFLLIFLCTPWLHALKDVSDRLWINSAATIDIFICRLQPLIRIWYSEKHVQCLKFIYLFIYAF